MTEETAAALTATMAAFNAACNHLSALAWERRTFRPFDLHRLAYYPVRAEFGLPAQLTVRAIKVVADSYKADRSRQHVFGQHAAVVYDARVFKLIGQGEAELTTVHGRKRFALALSVRQRAQLGVGTIGEADLLCKDGTYYLAITVKMPAPPPAETRGFLGVDLGIKNIAADSDGTLYAGGKLRYARKRARHIRRRLQQLGTRGARRLLVKRRQKEARRAAHLNHCISKQIVAVAEGTGRGVALEDLTGIRDRTTVSKASRAEHSGWAFHQLRFFLEYKCAAVGLPCVAVDARHSSCTCPRCGCVEKRNRKSQSLFHCIQCGEIGHADLFAAQEIALRGCLVSQPNYPERKAPGTGSAVLQGKATPPGERMPPASAVG